MSCYINRRNAQHCTVLLLDWFDEENLFILILEYPHPCVNLQDFFIVKRVSENRACDLMRQAVNAVKHCIDHNVCHGSLVDSNVLINIETMELKVRLRQRPACLNLRQTRH